MVILAAADSVAVTKTSSSSSFYNVIESIVRAAAAGVKHRLVVEAEIQVVPNLKVGYLLRVRRDLWRNYFLLRDKTCSGL